jgi:hypothetical protein
VQGPADDYIDLLQMPLMEEVSRILGAGNLREAIWQVALDVARLQQTHPEQHTTPGRTEILKGPR